MELLLINGPNLNLLRERKDADYGDKTLQEIVTHLEGFAAKKGMKLLSFQSACEGALIDFIHQNSRASGAIINAGGYAHTSVALRDAVVSVGMDFVEVHLTNVHTREAFRHKSYLSDVALGTITGLGVYGYEAALNYFLLRGEIKKSS